jgi:Xaa-Pro aminopeptidase
MTTPRHPDLHRDNRRRFLEAIGEGAALLFGAPHHTRNGDAEFRYRQSSDVWWLTGWEDPEVAILLRPGADQPFVMFVQAKDPDMEVWTGRRPGVEGAVEHFGADAAWPYAELAERLPDLLQGYADLHYRFADDGERDQLLMGAIGKARRKARKSGLDVPDAFYDPSRVLHELRLIKQPVELDLMREASRITVEAHCAAMARTAPGVREYEIESLIDGTFRRMGGNGPGYTTIVGGGVNATILHYITNRDELRDGDLVCVDAGCEFDFYTADVTRTWPVSGTFSDAQRELYNLVLEAQEAVIALIVPGTPWKSLHDTAVRVLTIGMVRLGLLEGDADDPAVIDELIATDKFRRYYMHGTGHWLGIDVHDVGAYAHKGVSRVIAPGMVMTVEPGLYIRDNDEQAPERFRGIGIRIEDDVLCTEGAPEVLTEAAPKRIDEVEALVGTRAEAVAAAAR